MAKVFYTERDVDEMQSKGLTSIDITDNVVMTDLALERAMKYGMTIHRGETSPAPKATYSPSVNLAVSSVHEMAKTNDVDLKQKIKALVLAKLDGQVDAGLLDSVIERVLAGME